MDDLLQSYDEAPYPSNPFYQTHPDSLATPAWLAGLSPTPVEKCRVLEIGSGTSTNLIAMAQVLPESRFVGVDLSPAQIALGQTLTDELHLENVELRAGDILTMGASLGQFDYIICHGVYSWCPPPVQEAIWALARAQLTPQGVLYLSYNVLPGWRRRGVWRDLARWGSRGASDGDWRSRVREGRRFVELVADAAPPLDAHYGRNLRLGVEQVRQMRDSHFLHEYLEPYNQPLHFHEVAARGAEHGMQYLGESGRRVGLGGLPPVALKWLEDKQPDPIELQQALDFFHNTSFRRSLFCHSEVTVRPPNGSRVLPLHAHTLCEPASPEPDVRSDKPEAFRSEEGQLTTAHPLSKAILVALHRAWPRSLSFAELCVETRRRLGEDSLSDEVIAEAALQSYNKNLLALRLWPPRFTLAPGERPLASPLARSQSVREPEVTNLRHRTVALNAFEQALVRKLDGTRDRAQLVEELVKDGEAGVFEMQKAGQVLVGEPLGAALRDALPVALERLAKAALLYS